MSQSGNRVLIVDDDGMVRKLIRRALEHRGIEVEEAPGGLEALESVKRHTPDLVLLDAMMPELDGFEVCRRMREIPAAAQLPVLMLTSLDDEASVAHAYESGASDFFIKSARMTLLTERVRYILRASRTQTELLKSRGKLAQAQRIARLGSWEWNLPGQSVFCSEECLRILGLAGQVPVVHESQFAERLAGIDAAELVGKALAAFEAGAFRGEYAQQSEGAALRYLQIEAEAERSDGRVIAIHGTVQDVTERRLAEERMRQLANYDSLTGLANRNLFRERFAAALAEAERTGRAVAVLFIDLDRFKTVNDSLGHETGDLLLREVATRISTCLRGGDALTRGAPGEEATQATSQVARLGGDEFTVLLARMRHKDDAHTVAERILAALRTPFTLRGHEFWVSASIGMAVYPDDGRNIETLLMRADAAMYQVKAQGRDGHLAYAPSIDSHALERFRLEADLRKAIERDELRLYYQPIVDTARGRIVGAEALMRWQRGERMVSPVEFIPLAEESGLIVPMGEWALRTACRQANEWNRSSGESLYVAVNISARQFRQRDLGDSVRAALEAVRLAPHCLQLEITESVVMESVDRTLRTLNSVRELGVRFAIDDFGTGYSSLAYLKRLPIDTLKIDRSFVKDIAVDPDDEAIVSAIAGLARSLNLGVVAEGVETDAQMTFLAGLGPPLMQGYLFSPPQPAPKFGQLLAEVNGAGGRASWCIGER
ncbi:MAG: EAL domain-containing protein, partial [Betaproteobacteria bacterium]|nr:EAL domain-containing protein [Betaproteobacteria bacterium]